jgi:CheY-like chemotaxis protein
MHGTIGLQSSPGHGSRFWFRIPAGVPRMEMPRAEPAADLAALVIGLHVVIQGPVRDIVARECVQVACTDATASAIELLAGFGPQIRRVRVIIDASATARLEHAVTSLRAAAGSRRLEVIALLPPDADATAPPGVSRCLVKPLCTADLCGVQPDAALASTTGNSTRIRALPTRGSRGQALVVEDNAVNQEMARAMLDMLGFDVVTASNGHEGVQAAAANPELNLIFMDCQMPVMDGLAAARAIREAEAGNARVPIVALTGNAMPGDREACVAAGMDDYLAKPFSLSALRAMVDKWTSSAAA